MTNLGGLAIKNIDMLAIEAWKIVGPFTNFQNDKSFKSSTKQYPMFLHHPGTCDISKIFLTLEFFLYIIITFMNSQKMEFIFETWISGRILSCNRWLFFIFSVDSSGTVGVLGH